MINKNTLLTALNDGKITEEEFVNRYFDGKEMSESMLLAVFDEGISKKNEEIIEEALALLYFEKFPLNKFVGRLCTLLTEDWHSRHEDIAMSLKQVADPSSVECLFKAAELKFKYLGYDDTYQFARKCIIALSTIKNQEAIGKLQQLSHSDTIQIANYAKKELNRLGL